MKEETPQTDEPCNNWINLEKRLKTPIRSNQVNAFQVTFIKSKIIDFKLLESDIDNIHRTIKAEGNQALLTSLTFDEVSKVVEIRTFIERRNNIHQRLIITKFKELKNTPSDLLATLNKNQKIKLIFPAD